MQPHLTFLHRYCTLHIVLPTGTEADVTVDRSLPIVCLRESICRQLGVPETDEYSLCYADGKWLTPSNSLWEEIDRVPQKSAQQLHWRRKYFAVRVALCSILFMIHFFFLVECALSFPITC